MTILVTGANGFIGKNLVSQLECRGYKNILKYDRDSEPGLLEKYALRCDFIFHLAGVNRPQNNGEFMSCNADFTKELLALLEKNGNNVRIAAASSVQAELDNPYGKSKKIMEEHIFSYCQRTETRVFVYRLPRVFGKWCKPNYNSVVATFCYNTANGIKNNIDDKEKLLDLIYIDDVIEEFIDALTGKVKRDGIAAKTYYIKLGRIAELIESFRDNKIPDIRDEFIKKLYSTYLSYLPEGGFDYTLVSNKDNRGSFTEFLRTPYGQISVNVILPGIIKGNHWHHTKVEKFLTVSGEGAIRFKNPLNGEITEYRVRGDNMRVIDVPPGYAHNIENTGSADMIVIIWANENYNPDKGDTFPLEIK